MGSIVKRLQKLRQRCLEGNAPHVNTETIRWRWRSMQGCEFFPSVQRRHILAAENQGGIMGEKKLAVGPLGLAARRRYRPGLDPGYTASKHAALGLSRSIALDYAVQGLRCNYICPGIADIPMLCGRRSNSPPRIRPVSPAPRCLVDAGRTVCDEWETAVRNRFAEEGR